MPRDLVADANDNYRRAFTGLAAHVDGGETRNVGPLTAAASGLPVRFYNRLFVFEPPPPDDLATAVAWLSDRDVPFWVTATEAAREDLEDLATDVGIAHSGASDPGMVLPSLGELPRSESGAETVEVTTTAGVEAFVDVAASVFGTSATVTERVYRAALEDDRDRLFLGRVDGQAVACGLLIRTGDVAGVYTVGVIESFRRRGIGRAMTLAVLRAGRADGCRVGTLQSSAMAVPLYERLGFETVVTYHHFEPAD